MDEFKAFSEAYTCKETLKAFQSVKEKLGLEQTPHDQFVDQLSFGLNGFKVKRLLEQLKKRYTSKEYQDARINNTTKVLVVGAGPCGLRTAIEAAFLGCKVVLIDKRKAFSRNNVLHLWQFTVTDLKNLGIKHFFGQFAVGELNHISIRRLQLSLLKIALTLGVVVHTDVEFKGLRNPGIESGWKCMCVPADHAVSNYRFDVLIASTGARDALCEYDLFYDNGNVQTRQGFDRKEFRGKLSIAITANFVNSGTPQEMKVKEIGGVAKHFHQKLFKDLQKNGIQLENFVYYRDETHYFVMTATKSSLLKRGVFKTDFSDAAGLMQKTNIHIPALLSYVRDTANFCTNNAMEGLEFAKNSRGGEDVAMLDFSSKFEAVNASRVIERNGKKLLIALVGDSLLEPFWPQGTGCARGFLGAMDAAWMIKKWITKKDKPIDLDIIAERESIYKLLSQTTPDNIKKKYSDYTIDPKSRYQSVNLKAVSKERATQFYDNIKDELLDDVVVPPVKKSKQAGDEMDLSVLLEWCQKVLKKYKITVNDLTTSWHSGCELGALIHSFRPHLIKLQELDRKSPTKTMNLVVGIAERELGISPIMVVSEMVTCSSQNETEMATYIYQFYQTFKHEKLPESDIMGDVQIKDYRGSMENTKMEIDKTDDLPQVPNRVHEEERNASSDKCYICKKELFILERISVENHFCHRGCLKCAKCQCELNLNNYRIKKPFFGKAKFYCAQHARAGSKFARSVRKRPLPGDNFSEKTDDQQRILEKQTTQLDGNVQDRIQGLPVIPPKPKFLARRVTSATLKRNDFYNSRDENKEVEPEESIFEHNFGASIRARQGVFSRDIPIDEDEKASSESSDEDLDEIVEANLGPNINKNMTIKDAKAFWQTLKKDAIQRNVINYLQETSDGKEVTPGSSTMDTANEDSVEEENENLERTIRGETIGCSDLDFQPTPDDQENELDNWQKRKSSKNEAILDKAIGELNRESKEFSDRRSQFSATCIRPRKQVDSDFEAEKLQSNALPHRRPAFKRSDSDQSDIRHAQRVQLAARKLSRQRQQNKVFLAQEINRQLEEAEVRLQEVEQEGVQIEKALKDNPETSEDEKPRLRKQLCLLYSRRQELLQYEAELRTANEKFMESQENKVSNITNPLPSGSSDEDDDFVKEDKPFRTSKSNHGDTYPTDEECKSRSGDDQENVEIPGSQEDKAEGVGLSEGFRKLQFVDNTSDNAFGEVGVILRDMDDNVEKEETIFEDDFWECPFCTLHNDDQYSYCDACYAWKCSMCTLVNDHRTKKCEACYNNKPPHDQRSVVGTRESFA